jgi:hypothetical protein
MATRALRARGSLTALVFVSATAMGMPDAAPHEAAPAATDDAAVPFVWHHEHAKFNYLGITAHYTCDGLEAQVKRILVYLGARPGAKVIATGCPLASTAPGPHAWVDAEFDVALEVAPTDASAVPGVGAHWRDVKLAPREPNFLAAGDCELIEGMQDLLTHTLHLRGLKYRTSCMPGSLSMDGFDVTGQALKIADPKDAATHK